jgi:hypothetical protein
MKKFCFIAVIFILFAFSNSFALEIKWTLSKPHSEIVFLETMVGSANRAEGMHDFFINTPKFKEQKTQYLIAAFAKLIEDNWENVFVAKQNQESYGHYHAFLTEAIQSESLKDLDKRTKAIIKPDAYAELFRILREFEPIYEEVVWKPFYDQFKEQTDELKKIYFKNGEHLTKTIAKFYGYSIDPKEILWVGFYPIIQKKGPTQAESMGRSQSVGILIDEKDHVGRMGVILHEFGHYFYHERPAEMNMRMTHTFQLNSSAYSTFANVYFDEAVAAAVGNGWVVEKILGENKDKSWYNDEIIEGYARMIYPMVKTYLESEKVMDEAFYDNSIEQFGRAFPEIIERMDIAMMNIFLFSNKKTFSYNQIKPFLRKTFPNMIGINASSPINVKENVTIITDDPKTTRVFIFSPKDNPNVVKFFGRIVDLQAFQKKVSKMDGNAMRVYRTANQTPLILIQAKTIKDVEQMITRLKSKKIPR